MCQAPFIAMAQMCSERLALQRAAERELRTVHEHDFPLMSLAASSKRTNRRGRVSGCTMDTHRA